MNTINQNDLSKNMHTIGIIGAGQMGRGIAQVFAMSDFNIILCDLNDGVCEKSLSLIKRALDKLLEKNKISNEQLTSSLNRIKVSSNLRDLAEAQFVIEAIPEDLKLKKEMLAKIGSIVPAGVVVASNTSSLSITELGLAAGRPDKVIGMHFMNPAPLMKCVEVVASQFTSDETFEMVSTLIAKVGKEKIVVKDSPGFVINRILMPMINEAIHVFHSGVASVGDIDLGMKLSCNLPMGPLLLADFIGLDTVQSILNVLYNNLKDEKYKPCKLLADYIGSGKLGKKSGVGFYEYK